jgi:catechol-2,3-dioxygenase
MIPVLRLNHAVLYVSDLTRAILFYRTVFGFDLVVRHGPMAFLRAKGSPNHHDLGLCELGLNAARPAPGTAGLYHLAWELPGIRDLAAARETLIASGAFTGESDHGATKSVYGADPDGNGFELMVLLPRSEWGRYASEAPLMPLDWEKELRRAARSPARIDPSAGAG